MVDATEKQKRCIYALAKQVGESVSKEFVDGLTLEAASPVIDELKKKMSEGKEVTVKVEEKSDFSDITFGMATKLVYQRWVHLDKRATSVKEEFIEEVINTYKMFKAAHDGAVSSLGGN